MRSKDRMWSGKKKLYRTKKKTPSYYVRNSVLTTTAPTARMRKITSDDDSWVTDQPQIRKCQFVWTFAVPRTLSLKFRILIRGPQRKRIFPHAYDCILTTSVCWLITTTKTEAFHLIVFCLCHFVWGTFVFSSLLILSVCCRPYSPHSLIWTTKFQSQCPVPRGSVRNFLRKNGTQYVFEIFSFFVIYIRLCCSRISTLSFESVHEFGITGWPYPVWPDVVFAQCAGWL